MSRRIGIRESFFEFELILTESLNIQVAPDAAVVIGQLQESYLQFQLGFSHRMAAAHRSLAPHLFREVLTRQLSWDDSSTRQHVRTYVLLRNLSEFSGTFYAASCTGTLRACGCAWSLQEFMGPAGLYCKD